MPGPPPGCHNSFFGQPIYSVTCKGLSLSHAQELDTLENKQRYLLAALVVLDITSTIMTTTNDHVEDYPAGEHCW